jgi:hypothetical protein
VCGDTGSRIRFDRGAKHDCHEEEKQRWRRLLLQDETLLLRKQALLQESWSRLLHGRAFQRLVLLQEGFMSNAEPAVRTHLVGFRETFDSFARFTKETLS